MQGFPDFNVIVEEIDGTIYAFGGVYYQMARYTFVGKAVNASLCVFPPSMSHKDAQNPDNRIKKK